MRRTKRSLSCICPLMLSTGYNPTQEFWERKRPDILVYVNKYKLFTSSGPGLRILNVKRRTDKHSKLCKSSSVKVSVTVLVRPGPPIISPRTPVATEGSSMNLTCSSEGGSPAPDIFWYTEDR